MGIAVQGGVFGELNSEIANTASRYADPTYAVSGSYVNNWTAWWDECGKYLAKKYNDTQFNTGNGCQGVMMLVTRILANNRSATFKSLEQQMCDYLRHYTQGQTYVPPPPPTPPIPPPGQLGWTTFGYGPPQQGSIFMVNLTVDGQADYILVQCVTPGYENTWRIDGPWTSGPIGARATTMFTDNYPDATYEFEAIAVNVSGASPPLTRTARKGGR